VGFKVVDHLIFAEQIVFKDVITHIDVYSDPVGGVETKTHSKVVSKVFIVGKVGVAHPGYEIEVGIEGVFITDKYFSGKQIIADR
jgi:hypothetical protein